MLPEYINAIKTMTYDVPMIVQSLTELGETDIDLERVMEYIEQWVYEDMASLDNNIVYQDENGEEL